jgi:hypothetical protein
MDVVSASEIAALRPFRSDLSGVGDFWELDMYI